jgi:hypothetical protein
MYEWPDMAEAWMAQFCKFSLPKHKKNLHELCHPLFNSDNGDIQNPIQRELEISSATGLSNELMREWEMHTYAYVY